MGLKDVGERLKKRWQSLSSRQKILSLLTGIPLLVSLALLLNWAGKTDMAPLYTHLDTKDAAAVVEQLKASKIQYQLTDDGTTVLVPQKDLYDLRLQMAASNIVSSGDMGWELFDTNKLGVTDFDRQLNYQRALQEELRRTIIQLDEVDQARVHLVLPEKSVFVEGETPASASVALKLKPGQQLTPEHVRGIVLLVANSVESLKPEDVNVIDMEGNVLSDGIAEGTDPNLTGSALKHHQMQQDVEQQIEKQVQALLDKIFGTGKAIAVINADLDFGQHEKHTITYGNQVVRNESGSLQKDAGTTSGANGIPGVTGNVPNYDTSNTEIPNNQDNSSGTVTGEGAEDYSRNYEIDTTEEKTVFAPGEIKKLSVAVVVDGQLTQNKITEVQNLVIAAVGLQPNRGDQITVSSMAFDTTLKDQMAKSFADQQKADEKAAQALKVKKLLVAAGLGAVVLLVILGIIFRMRRSKNRVPLDVVVDEPVAISKIEEKTIINPEALERKEQQEKAKKYLEEQPEEAANILKTWLTFDE